MLKSICAGCALAALLINGTALAGDAGHEHHHQQSQDVGHLAQPPKLALEVHRDAASGWNIHLVTAHFHFAPEQVNREHIDGEGHAHLYVDDEKVARVYSAWLHLGDLTPGEHTLRATLNASTHEESSVDGELIAASQRIVQP